MLFTLMFLYYIYTKSAPFLRADYKLLIELIFILLVCLEKV